jgi:uncharacterized protein (DUF2461 family)
LDSEVRDMISALFSQATLEFLATAPTKDLAWLRANRENYELHLLSPLKSLVHALLPAMQGIDPALQGSPSRIQRDLRFHPNQPPLRGCAWVVFQNRRIAPEERPGFFFELFPNRYRYGMGFYAASSAKMDRFRLAVDANPARFQRIVEEIPPRFQLMGDLYRRSRAGHLPEPVRTWYDRKSFWIQVERPVEPILFSPELPAFIEAEWAHCVMLYQFLTEVAS